MLRLQSQSSGVSGALWWVPEVRGWVDHREDKTCVDSSCDCMCAACWRAKTTKRSNRGASGSKCLHRATDVITEPGSETEASQVLSRPSQGAVTCHKRGLAASARERGDCHVSEQPADAAACPVLLSSRQQLWTTSFSLHASHRFPLQSPSVPKHLLASSLRHHTSNGHTPHPTKPPRKALQTPASTTTLVQAPRTARRATCARSR